MKDKFEIKWEQSQITNWKEDKNKIVLFFQRFNIDISNLYDHIMSIDYDSMQVLCYLLSKIDKAIKICDFLDDLEKNNHEDVDVIKIYMLISHAEITSKSLKQNGTKVELVRKFFNPVESDLKYKIIPNYLADTKIQGDINFVDLLYKIRCQYTHEGNYTGRIFKRNEDNNPLLFLFKDKEKDLSGICGITYKEFLNIYMKALIENIKIFSKYKS